MGTGKRALWRSGLLIALLAGWVTGCSQPEGEELLTRVLIVVGPSNHAPGTHEVAAGGRLVAHCLENMTNIAGFEADVIYAWAELPRDPEAYATIVFIGDNFPGERLLDSEQAMKDISAMMSRGCGIVCIHYGTGLKDEDVSRDGDHPLLHWMGGYFATRCAHHQSIAKHYRAAVIEPADPVHPVSRGWEQFTLHDEPYINNYFGGENNGLLPGAFAVAVSQLPPDDPAEEIVAWGIERPDRGRGVGITMPHFYKNWLLEPLRRLILNSVVWTARRDVPAAGVSTVPPDLESFDPEAVEFTPKEAR